MTTSWINQLAHSTQPYLLIISYTLALALAHNESDKANLLYLTKRHQHQTWFWNLDRS